LASESITAERRTWILPTWLRGLLTLALVASALALLAFGWMQTGSPLAVEVDGHRYQVRTHATSVGEALRHAGFELYPEDRVSPGPETALQPDMLVQVRRARPVTLSADGQVRQLRTHAETVGELLQEAGIQLGPADEIWLRGNLVQGNAPLVDDTIAPREVSHRGGARLSPDADAPTTADPPLVALRRATSLTLDDAGATTTLYTTATTVGQVLQQHGVSLFLGDEVIPGLQGRIKPGMTVTIQRSVPVRIEVDGRTIRTRTRAENVAGVLGQEGIALIGKDRVEGGLAAPVRPDAIIRVTRVREELAVEFDPIPFNTVWVPDPGVEIDTTRLAQQGEPGLTKRRSRVVYEDGQEVDRFLEDAWTEQPPITKTLAYGTKIVIRTLETPDGPIEYWRKIRVYTTSYKPSSCGKPKTDPRYGYTRLGWKLRKGVVAVDPSVIPLRTNMYVPGYGFAAAGDTGGGVKGKFVDLGFTDTDYQSWHWWTDIYLLTPVPPSSQIRWILPDYPRFPDRKRR
jgi:uncharacterized protein YabE (DUF348 family)